MSFAEECERKSLGYDVAHGARIKSQMDALGCTPRDALRQMAQRAEEIFQGYLKTHIEMLDKLPEEQRCKVMYRSYQEMCEVMFNYEKWAMKPPKH